MLVIVWNLPVYSCLQAADQAGDKDSPDLKWAAAVDSNAPFAFYDAHNHLTGFEFEIITGIAISVRPAKQ